MSEKTVDVFVDQDTGKATVDCHGFEGDQCLDPLAVIQALMQAMGADLEIVSAEKKRPDMQREGVYAKTTVKVKV